MIVVEVKQIYSRSEMRSFREDETITVFQPSLLRGRPVISYLHHPVIAMDLKFNPLTLLSLPIDSQLSHISEVYGTDLSCHFRKKYADMEEHRLSSSVMISSSSWKYLPIWNVLCTFHKLFLEKYQQNMNPLSSYAWCHVICFRLVL